MSTRRLGFTPFRVPDPCDLIPTLRTVIPFQVKFAG
jgi:hypothetical protein